MTAQDGNFTHAEGVSLRDYVELQVKALQKQIEVQLTANGIALTLARQGMESRLDSMNEFRDTLKDQAARFLTRSECELSKEKLSNDIKELIRAKDKLEGKASQQALMVTLAIAITSFVIGMVGLLLRFLHV